MTTLKGSCNSLPCARPAALFFLFAILVYFPAALAADNFQRLADLNPGTVGSYPSNFTSFSGGIYFSAYTLDTGRELWKFDGTNVTLAADINDTIDDLGNGIFEGNDSVPAWFTIFNGQLYFSAYDARRGGELWRYDGTNAVRLTDINPDANDSIKLDPESSWPGYITFFNDALYFSANSGNTRENYELWSYNGSIAALVRNIHPDIGSSLSSYPQGLTIFGDSLFFMADGGANGYELWKFDGTTTTVLNINPGGSSSSSYPKYFTPFKNRLYFQAFHGEHGFELWNTDGSSVFLAADITPGKASSYPEYLTSFNGSLYFRASDPTHGSELWKYDGIEATLAAEINPIGDSFPKNLTVFGDQLIFAADDGVHGWELWKYDGTNATLIADLNLFGDSFPESLTIINNLLYFVATTPDTGYELWKYDGTSITPAADINPGPGNSYPINLAAVNGELFFSAADDCTSNWEPWVLNPPQTLTISVTSPSPGAFFKVGDPILFAVETSASTTNVDYLVNGGGFWRADAPPFSFTTNLPPGHWSISARATDNTGATALSFPVEITVTDPSTPPILTLTAPTNGAMFLNTDTITISATTTDNSRVTMVEFYANGALIASDATDPYTFETTLDPGRWSITAKATDNSDGTALSSTVNITVAEPNTAPTVSLTAPADNSSFLATDLITLTADASDNIGVAQVDFFANGSILGTSLLPPYTLDVNLPEGAYSITAKAADNVGITTLSTPIHITVTAPPPLQILSITNNAGTFEITATTIPGVTYNLEATTDFLSWSTVSTITASSDTTLFSDSPTDPSRFYRISSL